MIAIGSVVMARYYVMDVLSHERDDGSTWEEPYMHAHPGTAGVVVGNPDDDVVTVTWGIAGCGGTCDVMTSEVDVITRMWVKYTVESDEIPYTKER